MSQLSLNPTPPPKLETRPLTRTPPLAKLTVCPGKRRPSSEVDALLEAEVRELYTDLPYHGWEHIQAVRANLKVLIERCKKIGLRVDERALDRAALCHDLLSCADPRAFGFDSAEFLASHGAYNLLRKHGAGEKEARKVERIINATHALVKPEGKEEILIRAADLFSLAEDYEKFFSHTQKLHAEAEQIKKTVIPFDKFAFNSLEYLALYVWRFLELTPMARNAQSASVWHTGALENLKKLFLGSQEGQVNICRVVLGEDEVTLPPRYGASANYFEVVVHPRESIRETLLHSLRKDPLAHEGSSRKIRLVVPGSSSGIPMPDRSYDEIILTSARYLNEAARVVREEGVVRAVLTPSNFIPEKGIKNSLVQRFLGRAQDLGLEFLNAEEFPRGILLLLRKPAGNSNIK